MVLTAPITLTTLRQRTRATTGAGLNLEPCAPGSQAGARGAVGEAFLLGF